MAEARLFASHLFAIRPDPCVQALGAPVLFSRRGRQLGRTGPAVLRCNSRGACLMGCYGHHSNGGHDCLGPWLSETLDLFRGSLRGTDVEPRKLDWMRIGARRLAKHSPFALGNISSGQSSVQSFT
ncbi:hypothetical protein VTH06DRAFT_4955 [Thermothelomyces fergusii]